MGGSVTSPHCRFPTWQVPRDEFGYALDELDSDGITIETSSAGVNLGDDRDDRSIAN